MRPETIRSSPPRHPTCDPTFANGGFSLRRYTLSMFLVATNPLEEAADSSTQRVTSGSSLFVNFPGHLTASSSRALSMDSGGHDLVLLAGDGEGASSTTAAKPIRSSRVHDPA